MGPVDVNGSVHTARKQHQRKNIRICVRITSCVLCGLGLRKNPMYEACSTPVLCHGDVNLWAEHLGVGWGVGHLVV